MKTRLLHAGRDFEAGPTPDAAALGLQRDLEQDLALDTLIAAMAAGNDHVRDVSRSVLLASRTSDLDTVLHRQEVLADCLAHPGVARRLYDLGGEALDRRRKHWYGIFVRRPGLVMSGADDLLLGYMDLLEELRELAAENLPRFESHGFRQLFATLQSELSPDYVAQVRVELELLRFRKGVLLSAEVGPGGGGGVDLLLRRPAAPSAGWWRRMLADWPRGMSFRLAERDEAGARILSDIRDRALNEAANALGQSSDHVLAFFETLRAELGFYVGCLNLRERLRALGVPTCFPQAAAPGSRRLSARGLREPCLALQLERDVVPNDLEADGRRMLVVTGANQGGKSSFLRALGLAQLMTQAGLFVAADAFAAELCGGIFTHYKREEDAGMRSGKFDEELARMSAIADRIRPGALVLFNEAFAATHEREGSEIAAQIVRALLDRGIGVWFVTHLVSFAAGFAREGRADTLFLRAERRPDGTRTFRLLQGAPEETSYGADLYREIFSAGAG